MGGLPSAIYNLGLTAVSSQLTPIFGPRLAIAAEPSDLFGIIPNSITRGCTPVTPLIWESPSGRSRLIGAASSLFPNGISERIARSYPDSMSSLKFPSVVRRLSVNTKTAVVKATPIKTAKEVSRKRPGLE